MLGGISVGDPRHAAELTTIPRPPDGAEEVPRDPRRLLDAHETIIEKVRDGIERTEKTGDSGTNDLLMGDCSAATRCRSGSCPSTSWTSRSSRRNRSSRPSPALVDAAAARPSPFAASAGSPDEPLLGFRLPEPTFVNMRRSRTGACPTSGTRCERRVASGVRPGGGTDQWNTGRSRRRSGTRHRPRWR